MLRISLYILSFILLLFSPLNAYAHDLWLEISNYYPACKAKVYAKVVFGHNFPYEDILLSRNDLKDFYFLTPDGKRVNITHVFEHVKPNKNKKYRYKVGSLVGEIDLNYGKGAYIVAASRIRKGDKYHVPSEKYAKSIVVVGKDVSSRVDRVLGDRIEIVPLKSPAQVKPGDFFPVKILFEGKPLSTYVYATYAGYWSKTRPFPVVAKSDENGIAYIKINNPGVWLIVCNHQVDFSASLTFEIKE